MNEDKINDIVSVCVAKLETLEDEDEREEALERIAEFFGLSVV